MAWTGEVIGHALILTSPLAACYGAKLLARLTEQLEITNRGIWVLQSYACCRGVAHRAPRRNGGSVSDIHAQQCFDEKSCLQYNNAAFCYQSIVVDEADECVADDSIVDEDELGFCILTPLQALGALGDHAPQFAKIFVNGSTFVADRSEPGTVLSVDEYANRMHVSSLSRHQSTGGSPCADTPAGCLGPDQQASGGALVLRAATDGGRLSCRSISSCMTSVSCCGRTSSYSDPTASTRSSLDAPQLADAPSTSYCSAQHDHRGTSAIAADGGVIGEKDVLEGLYLTTSVQRRRPTSEGLILDKAHACMWRDAAAAAAASSSSAYAPCTPRTVATPPRPVASPMSAGSDCPDVVMVPYSVGVPPRRVQSDVVRHGFEDSGTAVGPVTMPVARSSRRSRAGDTPRSASHGGAVVSHDRQVQRRWVPAGARSMPQPLPSPICSRGGSPQLSSSFNSRASLGLQEGGISACGSWGMASVPHSPPQSAHSRPCGIVSPGAAPTSPSAFPAGLSKAPALPLPDGVSLESAVPPALRYYLEQARAAGAQTDVPECDTVAAVALRPLGGDGSGSVDVAAGRPGFVRATVEQLNTQRLVCCHVTPFAAAKTSRKTRPLAQRAASAK